MYLHWRRHRRFESWLLCELSNLLKVMPQYDTRSLGQLWAVLPIWRVSADLSKCIKIMEHWVWRIMKIKTLYCHQIIIFFKQFQSGKIEHMAGAIQVTFLINRWQIFLNLIVFSLSSLLLTSRIVWMGTKHNISTMPSYKTSYWKNELRLIVSLDRQTEGVQRYASIEPRHSSATSSLSRSSLTLMVSTVWHTETY